MGTPTVTPSGAERLKASVGRHRRPPPPPFEPDPNSAWDVAVAERIKSIQQDVAQLRSRLNWLFALILGAAVANVVLSLFR